MSLWVPERGYKSRWKPPLGARINWGHPLARGLKYGWIWNEGTGEYAYDITRGFPGDINHVVSGGTIPYWTPSDLGMALRFPGDGPNSHMYLPTAITYATGEHYTIAELVQFTGSAGSTNPGIWRRETGGDCFHIRIDSTRLLWVRHNGSTVGTNGPDLSTGKWWLIASRWDGSNARKLAFDGSTVTTGDYSTSSSAAFNLQIFGQQVGEDVPMIASWWLLWSRALTDAELVSLYVNPYAFLEAP